jgi:3-oxoacyl-[acyl-carrier protein] reductase
VARSILITGGNGGLALAMAQSFLEENSENLVSIGVRERRDNADSFAAQHSGRCHVITLDVTRESEWTSAIESILTQSGRLDVLVNNAGHHEDGLLAGLPESAWDRVVDSNLKGTWLGCRAVIKPMMLHRGGRIINISSLSALLAPMGQTNYAAAKAGVIALSQSLSKETARLGITVNTVCPGYIETAALASLDEEAKKQARLAVPMRRFGKPEEVAAVVRFLASPMPPTSPEPSSKSTAGSCKVPQKASSQANPQNFLPVFNHQVL